jgi:hypothetical protein
MVNRSCADGESYLVVIEVEGICSVFPTRPQTRVRMGHPTPAADGVGKAKEKVPGAKARVDSGLDCRD